ncbi:hypothetical protein [Nocardioides alkalitolerans]|uniref:hypothetical protein n=1 Tax=Nocardioides alkalitolerans TaxID=281714 RepID=UPI00048FBF54|nr:hypothetical protein [Nocardioides alkalitolerans]
MGLGGLVLDRLQRLSPHARAVVYDGVLIVAGLLALLVWVLPVFEVDAIGPVDLDELGSVGVAAAAVAALLARANTPKPTGGDHRADVPPA